MKDYKEIKFEFTFDKTQLETRVQFEDDTVVYIFIQNSMIFICDCDYETLSARIDAEEAADTCEHRYVIEEYEAYDLTDGQPYYLSSEYAELVSMSLVHLATQLL